MTAVKTLSLAVAAGLLAGTCTQAARAAKLPSPEEMWRIIQEQQRQIEALKNQVSHNRERVEVTAEAVEHRASETSTATGWWTRSRFGGYGELHYNNLSGSGDANDKDEIDFHRFVLYFGHDFNDRVHFFSELEVEHAFSGPDNEANGEVELEQAFLDFDINEHHTARAGLFLLPVGILNETHEPTTFFGVERNPVETRIIPSTWWEGGVGLHGQIAPGWGYDAYVHSGLNTSAGDQFAVRSGRQKVSKAKADDLAATARIKWTGMPGVELAGTLHYQNDVTQGADPSAGDAWLYEAHADVRRGPFGLRALYARWDLDGSGPRAIGADEQYGWYVEPSWHFGEQLGVFARYNRWDNQAGSGNDTEKRQWDVGLNWWPHPDVVVKADYQNQDNEDDQEQDGFNLGIGYSF